MRLPRDESGRHLASVLCKAYGYERVHQQGSHIILETREPKHRISVPDHSPLRLGTLNAILRAVAYARGLAKEQVARELLG